MADSQEFDTIIGADCSFKGEISFSSAAKLLGKFEGNMQAKGKILVADGSTCKASVSAREVAVEGHIEGNVEATDLVSLQPNGIITGDIVAARMSMADGASINGYCRIGVNGKGPVGKPAATAEVKTASQPATARAK